MVFIEANAILSPVLESIGLEIRVPKSGDMYRTIAFVTALGPTSLQPVASFTALFFISRDSLVSRDPLDFNCLVVCVKILHLGWTKHDKVIDWDVLYDKRIQQFI
jgi:hypothetical protein